MILNYITLIYYLILCFVTGKKILFNGGDSHKTMFFKDFKKKDNENIYLITVKYKIILAFKNERKKLKKT